MDQFIAEFRQYTDWLPNWMVSLGVIAAAIVIGLAVHRLAFRILTRVVENKDLFWRSVVSRGRRPLWFAILIFTLSFAANIAPLAPRPAEIIRISC